MPHSLWQLPALRITANTWFAKVRQNKGAVGANSLWWHFAPKWPQEITHWLLQFIQGNYEFAPLQQLHFSDETVQVWHYQDRLMVHCLLKIIKPTFAHIISPLCFHLKGPSGVKAAIGHIKKAVVTGRYPFVIRVDIQSYYASISRAMLMRQVEQHFDDPRLLHYLEAIISIAVEDGGQVFVPEQGIPRRSSLSPFFGALYLSPIDKAFAKQKGIVYARYMDDIVLLAHTKRQYQRAKKKLFAILNSLKLALSPAKSWMGRATHGFHFLGVKFEVPRSPQSQTQVRITIHSRSCARALDHVNALVSDAVHPATIQRYVVRWSTWWSRVVKPITWGELLEAFVHHARERGSSHAWYGQGLLRRRFACSPSKVCV